VTLQGGSNQTTLVDLPVNHPFIMQCMYLMTEYPCIPSKRLITDQAALTNLCEFLITVHTTNNPTGTATILDSFRAIPPLSTVTLRVVDQSGMPLSNALATIDSGWSGDSWEGHTDTNGVFERTIRVGGTLGCYVSKDGYYPTRGEFYGPLRKCTDHPEGVFVIVLKKILNRVPMIRRQLEGIRIPALNDSFAFDLEVGDWKEPYGKGKCADLWMKAELRRTERQNFDVRVTISVTNALDGIQEFMAPAPEVFDVPVSELVPPQVAPATGFTNAIVLFASVRPRAPHVTSYARDRNYIFRVRTRADGANNVVAANVGWILGDLELAVTGNDVVFLRHTNLIIYYYNPDPRSRSLEPE
jgi:hypothetical protein